MLLNLTSILSTPTRQGLSQFSSTAPVAVYTPTIPSPIPVTIIWAYYIVLDTNVASVQGYVNEPWTLQVPNATTSTSKLSAFDNQGETDVLDLAKGVISNYQSPSYYNLATANTMYSNLVSTTNFDPGDFELLQSDVGNGVYKTVLYALFDMSADPVLGLYAIVQSSTQFNTRCCANINISIDQAAQAGNADFCPSAYLDDGSGCAELMDSYCVAPATMADPVCGCYPDYIQQVVVDKDPKLKSWLGELKLPSGCATSCNVSTAYTGGNIVEPCDLTICAVDISNTGTINAKYIDVSQDCGQPSPTPPPAPTPISPILIYTGIGVAVLAVIIILLIIVGVVV